jgi:hypothetical protein
MGLDTKTDRLTDRLLQSDSDSRPQKPAFALRSLKIYCASFTTLRQSDTILESFQILKVEMYSSWVLIVWWLQVVETMYSDQELADMNLAHGNAVVTRRLYQERYAAWRCPDISVHRRLFEHGNFVPRVANSGRPRSTIPQIEEDILDVVNAVPVINTRRVQCKWVSLIRLFGECCENNSCIPTICTVYRPCHYKITLRE